MMYARCFDVCDWVRFCRVLRVIRCVVLCYDRLVFLLVCCCVCSCVVCVVHSVAVAALRMRFNVGVIVVLIVLC